MVAILTPPAILGIPALRPWSAYELTRQMRRNLDSCWPATADVGLTDRTREQLEALLSRMEELWASQ